MIREWIAAGAPRSAAAVDANAQRQPVGAEEADGREGAAPAGNAADAIPTDDVTFTSVAPIFLGRCAACHADAGMMGAPPEDLRLDTYERVIAGGERVVIVPGQPLASEVFRRVAGHSQPRMPLGGPYLAVEEIERLFRWIEAGAQDPAGQPAPRPVGREIRLGGMLTARWELDGLPLVVTGDTRLDDDPNIGDYVEVRGFVTPDGTIQVERLRVR